MLIQSTFNSMTHETITTYWINLLVRVYRGTQIPMKTSQTQRLQDSDISRSVFFFHEEATALRSYLEPVEQILWSLIDIWILHQRFVTGGAWPYYISSAENSAGRAMLSVSTRVLRTSKMGRTWAVVKNNVNWQSHRSGGGDLHGRTHRFKSRLRDCSWQCSCVS